MHYKPGDIRCTEPSDIDLISQCFILGLLNFLICVLSFFFSMYIAKNGCYVQLACAITFAVPSSRE